MKLNSLYDIIIIGAGPIGSYLAEKLSDHGHKTLVLEKKSDVGANICCTGIVSKECIDLLAIDDNLILNNANSARLLAPSGKSLRVWRNDTVAFVLDRPALNRSLASRAKNAGAQYQLESFATNIQTDSQLVRIQTLVNQKTIYQEAQIAIITTGMDSNLPQTLGLGTITEKVMGAQVEVQTKDIYETEVYLDHKLAPGGFAWLVPIGKSRALVGLIMRDNPKKQMEALLCRLKDQKKIISDPVSATYGLIPLKPLRKSYSNRILVVGEAAGQVKPITGGGIYYGLLCADIAMNTIREAFLSGDFSTFKLAHYQKQWQSLLKRELLIGYWSHQLFRVMGNRQIEILLKILNKRDIQKLITESYDFSIDWHSKLISKILKQLAFSIPK